MQSWHFGLRAVPEGKAFSKVKKGSTSREHECAKWKAIYPLDFDISSGQVYILQTLQKRLIKNVLSCRGLARGFQDILEPPPPDHFAPSTTGTNGYNRKSNILHTTAYLKKNTKLAFQFDCSLYLVRLIKEKRWD